MSLHHLINICASQDLYAHLPDEWIRSPGLNLQLYVNKSKFYNLAHDLTPEPDTYRTARRLSPLRAHRRWTSNVLQTELTISPPPLPAPALQSPCADLSAQAPSCHHLFSYASPGLTSPICSQLYLLQSTPVHPRLRVQSLPWVTECHLSPWTPSCQFHPLLLILRTVLRTIILKHESIIDISPGKTQQRLILTWSPKCTYWHSN